MVDKRDVADMLIDELIAGRTPEEIVGEDGPPGQSLRETIRLLSIQEDFDILNISKDVNCVF